MPFRLTEGELPQGEDGPTIREAVDAGVPVINLTAMIHDLEAARRKKGERQGGDDDPPTRKRGLIAH